MALIGKSAGKSFAYLLGVYLGDGCITTAWGYGSKYRPVFRLNTIDPEFALATHAALNDLGATSQNIAVCASKGRSPSHGLTARLSAEILDSMVEMTDAKLRLPPDIFDAPRDHKLAFIAGIMDSEGFVAANSNPTNRRYYMGFKSCDAWVPDFIRLLESVGIRIGKVQTELPRLPGYKPPTRFTIKMQSWVDSGCRFNIKRKQDRVDAWAEHGPLVQKKQRRLTSETNMQNAA